MHDQLEEIKFVFSDCNLVTRMDITSFNDEYESFLY